MTGFPKKFFVYGSLMAPEVLGMLLNEEFKFCNPIPAILKDYKRSQIKGASYPAITPCEGAQVQGLLIQVISQRGEQTLDDFETDDYQRTLVTVNPVDNQNENIDAYAYVWITKDFLLDKEWDYQAFRRNHLQDFVGSYKGWTEVENAEQ